MQEKDDQQAADVKPVQPPDEMETQVIPGGHATPGETGRERESEK